MSILGQFQFRRDIASAWTSTNPILLDGELGIEQDTDLFKIGDGVTGWNMLPYGGIKGDKGDTGRSIVSVTRTSGNGAAGTTDTYTITYSEAPLTSTFTVTNGADGISPTVSVGATTVVTPATNPSVTDADAGPNADLRFSLPRARNVSAGTTNTITPATNPSVTSGQNGDGDVSLTFNLPRARAVAAGTTNTVTPVTNPSVTSGQNGDGDVSLTFNLPRARAVAAGTTTTGNPGTNASVSSANDANGDVTLNFTIPRGDVGPAANSFTNIAVAGQDTIVADSANDTLTLVAGTNVSLTTNELTDSIVISSTSVATNGFGVVTGDSGTATADTPTDTLAITGGAGITTTVEDTPDGLVITNTDRGSTAVSAHEGAADPHPQYTTTAEASAAAPVQSVNGMTGNVVIDSSSGVSAVGDALAPASPGIDLRLVPNLTPDFSGKGFHGQLVGTTPVSIVSSPLAGYGSAFQFSGTNTGTLANNQAILARSANPLVANQPLTFECVYRPAVVNRQQVLISTDNGTATSNANFVMYITAAGQLAAATNGGTLGAAQVVTGSTTLVANTTYRLAAVFTGAAMFIFVNGTQVGTIAATNLVPGGGQFFVGRPSPTSQFGAGDLAQGPIDDIRISRVARYTATYSPSTVPLTTDTNTLILYHCNSSQTITATNNKFSVGLTNLFASTANSTAIQTVLTLPIPAGYLTAGRAFRFFLVGTQSQSAAATNVVVTLSINGTAIVTGTFAGGTAAQTNRPILFEGSISCNGTLAYGGIRSQISGAAVPNPIIVTNITGTAAAAANAHTLTLTVQTSTANAANIIRVASAFITEV